MHTPIPWAVGTGSLGCRTHDHHGYVICPDGDAPCVAFGIETLDDAQFIVRAVNNHTQLLAALEGVAGAVTVHPGDSRLGVIDIGAFWDAWPNVRDAIEEARK